MNPGICAVGIPIVTLRPEPDRCANGFPAHLSLPQNKHASVRSRISLSDILRDCDQFRIPIRVALKFVSGSML